MSMTATRGGDLLAHSLSLFLQNFRRAFWLSALVALAVLAVGLGRPTPENKVTWEILGKYTYGKVGIGIDAVLPGTRYLDFEYGWGQWHRRGDAHSLLPELETKYVPLAKAAVRPYLWTSAGAWVLSFLGIWLVFWRQGKAAVADKILDGQVQVDNRALDAVLRQFRVQKPANIFEKMGLKKCEVDQRPGLQFGGFEVPPTLVCRNFLVCGGVGTGKSTVIFNTLDDLRRRRIKTVIYDPHGEYSKKYCRPGKDYILNPADARCVPWDVFSDIKDRTQLVSLIKTLLPADQRAGEDFFVKSARKLLQDLMLYVRAKRLHISEVYRIASESTLQELYDILCSLKRSESKGDMDPQAAEQAQGIRSSLTASESVRFMDLFPQSDTPFSIRKWMEVEDDSWLFITSQGGDIHHVILPYISTTIDIALQSVAGVESHSLRRAVILDELDSAGTLSKLQEHLSQLRKFGVTILIGFQDINQLVDRYGRETTQSIITNAQNRLVLRLDNPETAEVMSKALGVQEVEQAQTGASWGADDMRDGESISKSKLEKAAIPARKIMGLPDLTGYLKIAGPFPVTEVRIKRKNRKTIHEGYIPAAGLVWDVEGQIEHSEKLEKKKVQKAAEIEAKQQVENEKQKMEQGG
ncbi:MAG: type IV secretion system DNA-binding domain-containing protein [Desulfomicrobium sp.]